MAGRWTSALARSSLGRACHSHLATLSPSVKWGRWQQWLGNEAMWVEVSAEQGASAEHPTRPLE